MTLIDPSCIRTLFKIHIFMHQLVYALEIVAYNATINEKKKKWNGFSIHQRGIKFMLVQFKDDSFSTAVQHFLSIACSQFNSFNIEAERRFMSVCVQSVYSIFPCGNDDDDDLLIIVSNNLWSLLGKTWWKYCFTSLLSCGRHADDTLFSFDMLMLGSE